MATLSENPSCTATTTQCYTKLRKQEDDKSFITKHLYSVLYLNEIPGAMDKMGWKVAAKIMRHWFDNPAWHMPANERDGYHNGHKTDPIIYAKLPPVQVEETIIKMEWARKFSRFEEKLKEVRTIWNNHAGIDLLAKRLRRAGWRPGMSNFRLGMVGQKASVIDNISQVNSRTFGNYWDTLDDFYGAIFKANLHVAVVGYTSVEKASKRNIFVVTDLGYYIRDTYDFNDGKKLSDKLVDGLTGGLGIWSRDKMLSKEETADYISTWASPIVHIYKYSGFVPVSNEDFYKWAKKHKKGGDFYVFSDVLWEKPPIRKSVITLPENA